ncbi:MAG: hypothetical protein K6F74_05485 [Prevotella sp.]|nr:hypothetical protein [Prevotella sp.]
MRIKINNNYKCFMSILNVNYWYDDDGRKIFIGWLWWGIDIIFRGYEDNKTMGDALDAHVHD